MNKDAAIKLFVKEKHKLLTSDSFDKKAYKKEYNDYFYEKHKNKFGKPTNKEIMIGLIEFLKSNGVDVDEIKQHIDGQLPFFRETSKETREELFKMLEDGSCRSALSEEALQAIKDVGAYKAVEQLKGKEIEDLKIKELEELQLQIEVKRQEYDSLPSILDTDEVNEPEINPEVEEVKSWWQRFYLKDNPFPNQAGLGLIPEELYEQIIYKTKPFQDTLSYFQQNSGYFFHTGFLLVGGYGYGKTTFIDYLSHFLINKNIIPIRITPARAFPDSLGFTDLFYEKLKKELFDEASRMIFPRFNGH